jgi:hypothetical protein
MNLKRVRVAFSFLTPHTWAPLMVGIAASGVFADYILRPAVDGTVQSACSKLANHQKLSGNVALDPDGVCKGFLKQEGSNSCLSPDRSTVQYSLKNSDQTVTKWVAALDSNGKINGIKELQLDAQEKSVLKPPVEYRIVGEDLIEVRPSPILSLKPERLNAAKLGGPWASYALIASVMRTAASSCHPGKYDELLRAAHKATQSLDANSSLVTLQSARALNLKERKGGNSLKSWNL